MLTDKGWSVASRDVTRFVHDIGASIGASEVARKAARLGIQEHTSLVCVNFSERERSGDWKAETATCALLPRVA